LKKIFVANAVITSTGRQKRKKPPEGGFGNMR
jgi:hypothetical protein